MPTLETDRLILRLFRETDLDAYSEMCADPDVMRYIGAGQPLSRSEAWRNMAMILGHWQLRSYGLWAVEEKASGVMIGRIGCWYPEGWPDFEIGWALRRAYWGKGFATEAATASLKYAFETIGRSYIISLIRPENRQSIRVAERLGEQLEGRSQILGQEVLVYGLHR